MMMYLSVHSFPGINYSVIQVASFTFCPKHCHEAGLKLIGHYFFGTRNKGLNITPTRDLNIDTYPDADFSGLYNHKEQNDPGRIQDSLWTNSSV